MPAIMRFGGDQMFTSIHLENYKTFSNITVDLSQKSGVPKSLVLIYGENGAGKSNFAAAFYTLAETMRTMDIRDFLQDFMSKNKEIAENESLLKMLRIRFRDMEAIVQDARAIGATGNLVLDFSFVIKGKKGRYLIEMDDKEIVHERLEYTLEKNKGLYFDITSSSKKLNEKVFVDKGFLTDIQSSLTKFWGKHSLLAILQHETNDKTSSYFDSAISKQFQICLADLMNLSCKVKCPNTPERGVIGLVHPMLSDLDRGDIRIEQGTELMRVEAMLNCFLPKINTDIKTAYYKKKNKENSVHYELYTQQMISGKLCDVPFNLESTGTQSILELLPFLLLAATGSTVIIDEMDTGIHDMRIRDILLSVYPEIDGQLIATTHNTLLMNSDLPASTFYIIDKKEHGKRNIDCITETVDRVHPNHNIQNRYLEGEYKGIPDSIKVSLNELLDVLERDSEEND